MIKPFCIFLKYESLMYIFYIFWLSKFLIVFFLMFQHSFTLHSVSLDKYHLSSSWSKSESCLLSRNTGDLDNKLAENQRLEKFLDDRNLQRYLLISVWLVFCLSVFLLLSMHEMSPLFLLTHIYVYKTTRNTDKCSQVKWFTSNIWTGAVMSLDLVFSDDL